MPVMALTPAGVGKNLSRIFVSSPDERTTPSESATPPLRHLAVIMDGNGRWAEGKGLSRSEGHRAGVEAARRIVEECLDMGLRHLTLYTFSQENWKRPKSEVTFLFDLLADFIGRELPMLERRGARLSVLGETSALPFAARKALEHAMHRTAQNTRMGLHLALNYSGREEIARAARLCLADGLKAEEITPEALSGRLYTAGIPDPELVVRTSGELRISNFLIFQCAYSEYFFSKTLWPDFTPEELRGILADFAKRTRRFGGI